MSEHVRTTVEILNRSLSKIAEVKNLYPINNKGMVLRYTKELSDYGQCTFRIRTNDPIFEQYGDILIPHKYHVRIRRGETVVWQGTIVDNSSRQKNYQEIIAYEYLYYFDKILVKRTKEANAGEGFHYREFITGTMSSNLTTVLTEMKAAFGTNHIMNQLAITTVDNPNYPTGYTTVGGAALTGPWNFSTDLSLSFDYHSVLFVTQAFSNYGRCDFKVDNNLNFSFRTFLGNKQLNLTFMYGVSGTKGNIVDYNIPRYGRRMANDLFGIAVGQEGKVLYINKRNEASITEYGLLQSPMAFSDVKTSNPLQSRVEDQLRFVKDPENSPLDMVLDETGYPLGQYDVGDIVWVKIKDNVINYNEPRRIVRITVNLHNTGRELSTVTTNKPRDEDLA